MRLLIELRDNIRDFPNKKHVQHHLQCQNEWTSNLVNIIQWIWPYFFSRCLIVFITKELIINCRKLEKWWNPTPTDRNCCFNIWILFFGFSPNGLRDSSVSSDWRKIIYCNIYWTIVIRNPTVVNNAGLFRSHSCKHSGPIRGTNGRISVAHMVSMSTRVHQLS